MPLVMEYVAVLDLRAEELTARFGWTWAEGEEAGLGTMKYVGLAYDGRSRYVLIASVDDPGRGVALEAAEYEDPAQARADFLAALDLEPTCSCRSARARLVRALGRQQAVSPGGRLSGDAPRARIAATNPGVIA